MLSKRNKFLIRKGLRVAFTNPRSLYYKYKQHISVRSNKIYHFKHEAIEQIDYCVTNISYTPDIIIPIYNGYELLQNLLDQLLSHNHIYYNLILINDYSTDERIVTYLNTLLTLKTSHHIKVISNTSNLGFVQTVNLGMSLCSNHFIILNTDTEVPKNFVAKLFKPIFDNEKVASVTPFTNSGTIYSFPKFLSDNEIFMELGVQDIDNAFEVISPVHNITTPTGMGFCMAINKKVYDEIGGFDYNKFGRGYGEENDWCMRAFKAGYSNVHAVNCFVYHKHGGSFNTAEKAKLIEINNKKLERAHPEYIKLKHKYLAQDPAKDLRIFVQLKLLIDNYNAICIFNSVQTGGSNSHMHTFIKSKLCSKTAVFLIQSDDFIEECKITIYYDDKKFKVLTNNIFSLLEKLAPGEIMINHLLFNDKLTPFINSICNLKNKIKAKLTITLHDYFLLCPTINLLDYENKYCGLPIDERICNNCLQNFSPRAINNEYVKLYNVKDISSWRKPFEQLLVTADEIMVLSEYVKGLFIKIYGNIEQKIIIFKQEISYLKNISSTLKYLPFQKNYITIATLGNITKHKGSVILNKLVKLASERQINIKWVVLGDIYPYLRRKNLIVHGSYNINDLCTLLNQYQPDIFILPSIWPETFCYTASEMMHFALPVISFNIGAHANRIAKYEKGYLVDKIDPNAMLEKIIEVIKLQ